MKNRITILALHLNYGGVEQYISSLCKMLEDDYDIEIIVTYKSEKPAFYFNKKIKIVYLLDEQPNRSQFNEALCKKNFKKILQEGLKAIKILFLKYYKNILVIRKIKSNYIITTRIFHNKLVNIFAKKGITKISTEHNFHNNDKKYIKKLIKSVSNYDYFISVSQELNNFYKNKIKKAKCIYIPNVINEIPKKSSKLEENILLNVGRIEPEKAQNELIYIIRELKKHVKNIKLYIVGDGSLKQELYNKIKEYKLEKNIIITGFLPKQKLEEYYLKSKLFTMTSTTESFGIVLLESMSYGVPCIAYDSASGAKELLNNNVGILIKDRNREEYVHQALLLLNDDKKIKSMGKTSKKYCEKYLIDNVKKMWIELLKEK